MSIVKPVYSLIYEKSTIYKQSQVLFIFRVQYFQYHFTCYIQHIQLNTSWSNNKIIVHSFICQRLFVDWEITVSR